MKDKQGVLRTEKSDRMERWKEHFSDILNRDAPNDPITEKEKEEVEELEGGSLPQHLKVSTSLMTLCKCYPNSRI